MNSTRELDRADVLAAVFESIHEILPTVETASLRPDVHLRDLGADSIDRVEIIAMALGRLGIGEPLASFTDLRDIDGMVDLLYRKLRS